MDYNDRISPNKTETLQESQIFVFGANEMGRHGAGAALKAAKDFGAIAGQGNGLQGQSYGIPTKGKHLLHILTLEKIQIYVDEFIEFAKVNPQLTFLVTQIGCGYSKYKPHQIAPLFKEAVDIENIHLPKEFWEELTKKNNHEI